MVRHFAAGWKRTEGGKLVAASRVCERRMDVDRGGLVVCTSDHRLCRAGTRSIEWCTTKTKSSSF